MDAEKIIRTILEEAFYIHKKFGPGLFESVYQNCLVHRCRKRGLWVDVEKPVPVYFEGMKMPCGFRADMVIENKVVVDTKCIDAIGDIQIAQLLTYLRLLEIRHGLILNFKSVYLKDGIKRVLNGY